MRKLYLLDPGSGTVKEMAKNQIQVKFQRFSLPGKKLDVMLMDINLKESNYQWNLI